MGAALSTPGSGQSRSRMSPLQLSGRASRERDDGIFEDLLESAWEQRPNRCAESNWLEQAIARETDGIDCRPLRSRMRCSSDSSDKTSSEHQDEGHQEPAAVAAREDTGGSQTATLGSSATQLPTAACLAVQHSAPAAPGLAVAGRSSGNTGTTSGPPAASTALSAEVAPKRGKGRGKRGREPSAKQFETAKPARKRQRKGNSAPEVRSGSTRKTLMLTAARRAHPWATSVNARRSVSASGAGRET
ncbi:hypothetical protein AURDEDRAFT_122628 [Auricularia subglabra TFB-10046 SS5]|nr:hypothetical protein AURDEDRAFT_122628 [Auricularia subglabra TFB-10046 SS5]